MPEASEISEASETSAQLNADLTAIVPAFNEAATLAATVCSLQEQTRPPAEIIVVDDCSTDETAAVAASLGVSVIQPPRNTGSKAGAQTFALAHVRTEFVIAVDADTTLAPDAIEKLAAAFEDPEVAAACGFVLPRRVRSIWERGRYVEYMLAFSFFKRIQDHYGKPLISSGCFSIYRTAELRELGGWSTRTMAEDMDLTWTMYAADRKVRFLPEAVAYPIEPHNLEFLGKQLRRWSHGFIQNMQLHWRGVLAIPFLRSVVMLTMWDATLASLVYLVLLPLLALVVSPLFLLGYIVDTPALLVPIMAGALARREGWRAIRSVPAFWILRLVNALFFLEAIWTELVLRRPFRTYEKGH